MMRTIKITTTNKASNAIANRLLAEHIPHHLVVSETEAIQVQHVVAVPNYPGVRVLIDDTDDPIAVYHRDSQHNIALMIDDGDFAMDALYRSYDGTTYIAGICIQTGTPIMAMINDL